MENKVGEWVVSLNDIVGKGFEGKDLMRGVSWDLGKVVVRGEGCRVEVVEGGGCMGDG